MVKVFWSFIFTQRNIFKISIFIGKNQICQKQLKSDSWTLWELSCPQQYLDFQHLSVKDFQRWKKTGSHFFMGLRVPSLVVSFKKLGWRSFSSCCVDIVLLRAEVFVEEKSILQSHDYGLCLCEVRVFQIWNQRKGPSSHDGQYGSSSGRWENCFLLPIKISPHTFWYGQTAISEKVIRESRLKFIKILVLYF